MNKLLYTFLLALLTAVGIFHPKKTLANAAAGELMYKWVSGSTYDLYVKYYRDCSGAAAPNTLTVCYTNTCNNFQGAITLNQVLGLPPSAACGSGANGIDVPVGCPQSVTTCQNPAATLPGYQESWYSARLTLPTACNFWRFSTSLGARSSAITNLANPGTSALYLEATLYSAAGTGENPGNTSPCFTVRPLLYINNNIPISFSSGMMDADGDSLTCELIMPRNQDTGCNGVNMAFSQPQYNLVNNPFATVNTFLLNSITSQMTFTSLMPQRASIAMLVKEYQNGVLRGTSVREMQIVALPGIANHQPQPSPPTTITGGQAINGRFEGCTGRQLQFCFNVLAPDTTARLIGMDNHNNPPPGTTPVAPGASLVYNNLFGDSLNVCFSWTPTRNDTGLHNITVTVRDTVCHLPGTPNQITFALPVYINPAPIAGVISVVNQSPTFTFSASGTANATTSGWNFGDGASDTARTATHTYTANGTYTVTFYAANDCGTDSATVTIVLGLGVNNASLDGKLLLFPSPAHDFVTVQNTATVAMKTIRIMDVAGATVGEVKAANGAEQQLNVSHLAAGIYLLRIEMADGTIAVRRMQVKR